MCRRLLHIAFICSCLCACFAANAKENEPLPAIRFITSGLNDSVSCTLPFSRVGNLILLRATADTTEGNFILDTGAPHLVLNITYFRDYPTTQTDAEQTSITGAGGAVQKTAVRALSFGAMEYTNSEADLLNLGHIENSKGVKILGLLGMALFRQCEMIIDYENNLIYLHRIGRKESSIYRHAMLNDTAAYRTIPIDITDNRIIATTQMGGKKLKWIIDCAAESNVLDSRLPSKVFDNVTVTRRVQLAGASNQKVEALFGSLRHLRLGGQEMPELPVLITNLEKTCFAYGGCVDGVLGFDFLSLQKVGFNFVNHKMYVWK